MTTDRTDMLWPADVAQAAGYKDAKSVRALAGKSKALAEAGNLKPSDLPPPDGRAKRAIPTKGGTDRRGGKVPAHRMVWQPYWWPETIEAWLPNRRRPGNPNFGTKAGTAA